MVEVEIFFLAPERVVLYSGTPFWSIPVIKVVKKLIKQKTRENAKVHLNRAKKFQRKLKENGV